MLLTKDINKFKYFISVKKTKTLLRGNGKRHAQWKNHAILMRETLENMKTSYKATDIKAGCLAEGKTNWFQTSGNQMTFNK